MANQKGKVLATNRKARHEYFIEEALEAGIVLVGTEVKSIRMGKINIKEGYAQVDGEEVFLHGVHISPYEKGNIYNKDPLRVRKLLLHKREIRKLIGYIKQKGYTLIPLEVYLKKGMVKISIGVAKGKALHDKRRDIAKRDANRNIQKALRQRQKEI
ncbi:SsrA-binding protein SmpB [Isachenkonia alkalipeptolytica]|uniref:SsrA-binding protein SmpB n=1 Tax=Isachenkonia alkalipeptolytica TaxID=2565777 RepID=UPI00136847F6|nr:SsrA-binding protein SmpB [Isachenkonia alkalipeptolytica]